MTGPSSRSVLAVAGVALALLGLLFFPFPERESAPPGVSGDSGEGYPRLLELERAEAALAPGEERGREPVAPGAAARTLGEGRRVVGSVKDPDRKPLPGIPVEIALRAASDPNYRRLERVTSDARGEYALELEEVLTSTHRDAAWVRVRCNAPGFRPGVGEGPVPEGKETRLDLVLTPGVTVSGTVLSLDGEPVGGARVQLEAWLQGEGRESHVTVVADEESDPLGRFALAYEAQAPYAVVAREPSLGRTSMDLTRFDGNQSIDCGPLVLEPGPEAALQLVCGDGRPLGGVWVAVSEGEGGPLWMRTDDAGIARSKATFGEKVWFGLGAQAREVRAGGPPEVLAVEGTLVRVRLARADGSPVDSSRLFARTLGREGPLAAPPPLESPDELGVRWMLLPADGTELLLELTSLDEGRVGQRVPLGGCLIETDLVLPSPEETAGLVLTGKDEHGAPLEACRFLVASVVSGIAVSGDEPLSPGEYLVAGLLPRPSDQRVLVSPFPEVVRLVPGERRTLELVFVEDGASLELDAGSAGSRGTSLPAQLYLAPAVIASDSPARWFLALTSLSRGGQVEVRIAPGEYLVSTTGRGVSGGAELVRLERGDVLRCEPGTR